LDRLMEVAWWMPCFWMSQIVLTLWLPGTSNKLIGGYD